jgi:hypothetical protein
MKKFGSAAYLCILAAVLTAIACFLYKNVMYTEQYVLYMLIGAVALLVIGILMAKGMTGVANYVPIFVAFLLFSAAVWATKPMVNQLGYVVAGLEPMSTVTSFFTFAGLTLAAGFLVIVASFLRMGKEA